MPVDQPKRRSAKCTRPHDEVKRTGLLARKPGFSRDLGLVGGRFPGRPPNSTLARPAGTIPGNVFGKDNSRHTRTSRPTDEIRKSDK